MELSESAMDYLTRLQGIVAALADIGENFSDSSLIAKMLGGLPSRFNICVRPGTACPRNVS